MAAGTKIEQTMWVRAFAVVFELRARMASRMAEIDESVLQDEDKAADLESKEKSIKIKCENKKPIGDFED